MDLNSSGRAREGVVVYVFLCVQDLDSVVGFGSVVGVGGVVGDRGSMGGMGYVL